MGTIFQASHKHAMTNSNHAIHVSTMQIQDMKLHVSNMLPISNRAAHACNHATTFQSCHKSCQHFAMQTCLLDIRIEDMTWSISPICSCIVVKFQIKGLKIRYIERCSISRFVFKDLLKGIWSARKFANASECFD